MPLRLWLLFSPFEHFQLTLGNAGYQLIMLWSANTGAINRNTGKRMKYDNLACFKVHPARGDVPAPRVATIVVVSYGEDGLGVWTDEPGMSFGQIVDSIAA